VLPLATYAYYHKKIQLHPKPLIIGALVWFIVTQILEKAVHFLIITQTPLTQFPVFFSLYAALTAGVFEELGRFFAFKKLLPKYHEKKDAISYGIGHGGIESIIIGTLSALQFLIFSLMINMGQLAQLKQSLPGNIFTHIINAIYGNPIIFLLGGLERFNAFFIQIALSLLVLLAIQKKQNKFLLLAIVVHTLIDLPPALYQTKLLNLWIVEILVTLFGVSSLMWIKKQKTTS
jgi:uncharacterized membrane protein YhfC